MVIISSSSFHQKHRFDLFFPIEIPLFHEQPLFHFKLSRAYFEGFLLCFVLPMSCPQGPFGSWKFDFLIFSSPLFRMSCPQGPFGSWKIHFRSGARTLRPTVAPWLGYLIRSANSPTTIRFQRAGGSSSSPMADHDRNAGHDPRSTTTITIAATIHDLDLGAHHDPMQLLPH